jgi:hemolysin activation/secretion protein
MQVSSIAFADEHLRVRPFAAFTWRDAEGRYPRLQMSEVRSRVAEVGVTAQHSGDRTAGYSRAMFSRGLDVFGASSFVNNGSAPDVSFSKASFDLAVIRVLASQWRMRIDAEAQWSDADLPAGERFTFGGAQFGRAFDAAELTGDTGGAVSVQIERVQALRNRWLQQSSVYLQSDYGYARDHVYGSDTASSIAAGWKLAFTSILANLELSTPLQDGDGSSSADSVRAFAQLQILF